MARTQEKSVDFNELLGRMARGTNTGAPSILVYGI